MVAYENNYKIPLFLIISGTSSERRKTEIARLNSEFEAMSKLKLSLSGILHYMIETENYRMLSAQEYTWRESPIRSGRVCELKDRTVSSVHNK